MSDDNITRLPRKAKPSASSPLSIVCAGQCQHRKFEIDDRLDRVRCRDCGEMLNPMWVLRLLANEDSLLRDRWAHMRAHIQLLGDRAKVKCTHCAKMTPIPRQASAHSISMLAHKLRSEEEA